MYQYRPQNEDELELREGDRVDVMQQCDDGWFVGMWAWWLGWGADRKGVSTPGWDSWGVLGGVTRGASQKGVSWGLLGRFGWAATACQCWFSRDCGLTDEARSLMKSVQTRGSSVPNPHTPAPSHRIPVSGAVLGEGACPLKH